MMKRRDGCETDVKESDHYRFVKPVKNSMKGDTKGFSVKSSIFGLQNPKHTSWSDNPAFRRDKRLRNQTWLYTLHSTLKNPVRCHPHVMDA